ncbi:MAG: 1-phosphofructokinase family hexose kinase [Frankiaceae bacterium]
MDGPWGGVEGVPRRSSSEPTDAPPRVVVFGPNPLLTVTIEARPDGAGEDVHLHPGGQGVWVARMAGELGADPMLCGLLGGEIGITVGPLLEALPGQCRVVATRGSSGCVVADRRGGTRRIIAVAWSPPPSRHELDDLFSLTCAGSLGAGALVVCNPFPGEGLPLEVYANLVSNVRANGTPVLVDLSTPRLDSALESQPDLVKLNDWELAEYIEGPVDTLEQRCAAVARLLNAGATSVVVTRGPEPAFAVSPTGEAFELVPPRFDRGSREGCGDTMMGAVAAAWARGRPWLDALAYGVAAGAANFLRHGLGSGLRPVVEEVLDQVRVRPLGSL